MVFQWSAELRNLDTGELMFACASSLRANHKNNASTLIKEMQLSPTRASKMLQAYKQPIIQPGQYTNDEALSLIVDGQLTKSQYNMIRAASNDKGVIS